jgi:hypothetical protein
MKKLFLLAGMLLATPAYANSWSEFYTHPMPQTTTIEMRKSWQDHAGDAVHHASPRYEYSQGTLSNAPPWMKLNCHKREHRWALRYHSYTMCR